MQRDMLRNAISQCPFLHRVSLDQGESFALQIAANPFKPACPGATLPLLEDAASFESAIKIFHGPEGVVPLRRFADRGSDAQGSVSGSEAGPHRQLNAVHSQSLLKFNVAKQCGPVSGKFTRSTTSKEAESSRCPARKLRSLPMASIGLSAFGFLPDPGDLFGLRHSQRGKPKPQRHRQQGGGQQGKQAKQQRPNLQLGGGKGGPSIDPPSSTLKGGSSPPSGGAAAASTTPRSPTASGAGGAGAGSRAGGKGGGIAKNTGAAGGGGGQCPLRRYFAPLGGLLPLTAAGQLQCPSAIVKMRAAVAALKPVRDLRPQALPVRALAMGATAVAANVPCGMWREHTHKFSPQWFLAVHATIPFVATLRKAVLMPKWAILLTLLGSMAGQQVGAQLERRRLAVGDFAVAAPHALADSTAAAAQPQAACRHQRLCGGVKLGRARPGTAVAAA